eukprot:TRINITY_DN1493_c0_g1_i1.p1 TRINITY_DN1493_c0_g1~~TRINITY_DN1493_c0_g1_i1.p1  ORF type:complete len:478 (-),score=109.82 TRINITY_DN1493_c0_g1_i1:335-1651(-)
MNSSMYPKFKLVVRYKFEFHKRKVKLTARKRGRMKRFLRTKDEAAPAMNSLAKLGRPYPAQRQMKVFAYQARDLAARDDNGLSDPYLIVQYCGQRLQTKVVKNNCNPQWLDILSESVMVPQPSSYAPDIKLMVFDKDMFSQHDLIGRCSVSYDRAINMTKPEWFALEDEDGNKDLGELYLAFEFIDPNHSGRPKFSMNQNWQTYYLSILTLGVRNIRSSLPIMKSQIKYATNDGKFHVTKRSSRPSAKNANFLSVHKLELKLPEDIEMAPAVSVVCNDVKFGIMELLVGTSTIHLRDFMVPTGVHTWIVKETGSLQIVDDKQIQQEIDAELEAEKLVREAEQMAERAASQQVEREADTYLMGADMASKLQQQKRWDLYESWLVDTNPPSPLPNDKEENLKQWQDDTPRTAQEDSATKSIFGRSTANVGDDECHHAESR